MQYYLQKIALNTQCYLQKMNMQCYLRKITLNTQRYLPKRALNIQYYLQKIACYLRKITFYAVSSTEDIAFESECYF